MKFLYNFAISSAEKLLPVAARFNQKLKSFTEGRKNLFEKLAAEVSPTDKTIWIHAASLGEYEQAVPVLVEMRKIFPQHKIIVSFFSPSGYEVKKNSSLADVVTYLPLDTKTNAQKFLDIVHPELVLFVKYEFWPNFLKELQRRKIRSLLISGAFREDQAFFKFYGKWLRKYLKSFEFFFLQNKESLKLLEGMGFINARVSGDTRYDRVYSQLSQDNRLDFIEEFVDGRLCVVAGSTWPEDEELLLDLINNDKTGTKFIIAPHALKVEKLKQLQEKLHVPWVLYSKKDKKQLQEQKVFIIDTIGLLTRIYSYADIAYVGGAAGETGLHNVLEPAAFGVPIVIGKNFSKFPEAGEIQSLGGLFSVKNSSEAQEVFDKLISDKQFRNSRGSVVAEFVENNRGATKRIAKYISDK
ncbi:3-deoxy-D-manno-octulosonic acid transferase [Salinimicrobium xinjiangense]|uniref:3-deoxy-D-manno-octulosonic acid transferase n=1 Tax=Salinimicrobium xinjiangense TaxID=438596 RepID=UPI000424DF72|nr:glycosyltransferase N-terminal domain-containing protein [Salinimicrobium xinjiangense]